MTRYKIDIPEGVKAFFLLNAANMTEENEKLARTTAGKLTYSNMKETIMRILEIMVQLEMKVRHQLLKEEVLYAGYQRGSSRRGSRGRGNRYSNKELKIENQIL